MATKYYAVLTNVGAAKMANATALGAQVEITQMAVGDGNGALPTPNPAQTALVHELRRAPLNTLSIDPNNANQIIAEQVIPEDVGGWWIREIGLFDKDGDMIAVANCAETYKPQLQEGSGRVQVIRVILIVSSTEAVTLKIDPAVVLATRQYVDNQLSAHEQSRKHPDASTTDKGFVQLSSSVNSESESQAATPKAVKIAMDNATARLAKDRNLSDLPNPALARQNLALGDSSTRNVGTTAGTVASGDDARITGAMQKSQNGGDIPDVAKFLQNIGLQFFKSSPSEQPTAFTSILSPDGKLRIVLANNGEWGVQDEQGNTVALPPSRGGTGATSAKQAVINLGLGAGAPAIGVPFFWPSSAMPNTVMPEWSDMVFLKYNGSTFSASAYPKLALVNPSLTLPDARGEFIRVWDDGRGVDSGRALLSAQSDAQQAVTGSVVDVTMGVNASASGAFQMTQLTPTGLTAGTASDFNQKNVYLDTSRVNRTAAENRPRNVAFNFLVRAK
ncbi:Phage tail fiber protein [Enterobacter hormaechei]|uniref:phage tail-collar fiber domain-containing protein n=1 Tax=Enterobacter cloacae complex TaxID=354276 RepID=UPI00079C72A4|nr:MULTISPECIES: phage tail protein [Enterobacter cloacae complex]MCK6819660.1 phage tail protein [Enterobacter chengduensis]MDP0436501.1 phage tail protein [Enterobacter hormaechei]RSK55058.1 phage tail protein [Enterobacter chengduensis]CZW01832.1 Phage tail fiber protein [Enterobacter hormaechei]CZW03845.1 Phage tail fiber protein [Enterobacter hormaechei]